MALIDMISSGGQTGKSMSDRMSDLQRLEMQGERLAMQKETSMANLQTLKEKRARSEEKDMLISTTMQEASQFEGTDADRKEWFDSTLEQRARATGRLDIVKELRESYGSTAKPLKSRTPRNVTPNDVKLHQSSIFSMLDEKFDKGDELKNKKALATDILSRAFKLQQGAVDNREDPLSLDDAKVEAFGQIMAEGKIKENTGVFSGYLGEDFIYSPDAGSKEGTPNTKEEMADGEIAVIDGVKLKRVGNTWLKAKTK